MTKHITCLAIVGLLIASAVFLCMGTYTGAADSQLWSKTYGGIGEDAAYSMVATKDGGYAMVGSAGNTFWLVKTDSSGEQLWNKTYGGHCAYCLLQDDDGYAMAGSTGANSSMGYNFWLVKTDSDGNQLWNQTYGGTGDEYAYALTKTDEGGYVIAGPTTSFGPIPWVNILVVKTDSSGHQLWYKTFGGTGTYYVFDILETSDGGYIISGGQQLHDPDLPTYFDFWLLKIDSDGNLLWEKTYGGARSDSASDIAQTNDGGYIMAGYTTPVGSDQADFLVVKIDAAGNMLWNKSYGGTNDDWANSIAQITDGGYIIVGYTESYGAGDTDSWVIRTNSAGDVLWNNTYGGTASDGACMVIVENEQYVIVGQTKSFGAGMNDFWLMKISDDSTEPPSTATPNPTPSSSGSSDASKSSSGNTNSQSVQKNSPTPKNSPSATPTIPETTLLIILIALTGLTIISCICKTNAYLKKVRT